MRHARWSAVAAVLVGLGVVSSAPLARGQTPPATFSAWSSDWSPTGSLGQVRAAATATLLKTGPNAGWVLITGGSSASASTNTAEIYNPAAGTGVWANSMAQARYFH